MAQTAFGSALAVGRLGVRRVGVLSGRDADLHARAELLARMVHDLPGTIRLEPVAGSPEVADWLLRQLAAWRVVVTLVGRRDAHPVTDCRRRGP